MRHPALAGLTSLVAVTALGACGGDGAGDVETACDAYVAIDRAFGIDEDPEAGVAALHTMADAVPDEVASDIRALITAMETDLESALESDELVTANAAVDDYARDNCADQIVAVEAVNFALVGVPAEIDAGRILFDVVNHTQTDEFHEVLVLRKHDDVEGSAHDVLMAGLMGPTSVEQTIAALDSFDFLGATLVEPEGPGSSDAFPVDLVPGEYIVACLLPVDSARLLEPYFAGENVEGVQHVHDGMFVEFTVS
jgi:hypothetical protein